MEDVHRSQVLSGDWVTSLQAPLKPSLDCGPHCESWDEEGPVKAGYHPELLGTAQQHEGPHSRLKVIFGSHPVSPMLLAQPGSKPQWTPEPCSWFRGSEVLVTPPLYEDTQRWMAGRMAGQLLSADCIQAALCSWRLQYFPSGRGKPASPELRKVTLVSELVGVQSQLCLETTRVPFPLLYDCSVNFRAKACKLKLK